MKKRKREDCFYWTGVYCEPTHEYQCMRDNSVCYGCEFTSDKLIPRIKFEIYLFKDLVDHYGFWDVVLLSKIRTRIYKIKEFIRNIKRKK